MGKKGGGGAAQAAEKAASKAAKRAKQESKAARSAAKQSVKKGGAGGGSGGGGKSSSTGTATGKGGKKSKGATAAAAAASKAEEEDLDALLANFKKEWEEEHKVLEERVGMAPTRRANATLTACPLGDDLWFFGGEYFDGDRATFYANLFRYTPSSNPAATANQADSTTSSSQDRGTWRQYSSANQPGPRSAHAVAASPAAGGMLFVFGGEFAGPKLNKFFHYRDLWIFSIANKSWDRIDTKVRPSARSGHRMVCWKQYIVLFGGFQDTGVRTTYLGDLWIFDTAEYKWHEIKQNELRKPPARSGFSLLSTPEGVVLYGGYCKRYIKGERTQGIALEDAWLLTIAPDAETGDLFARGKIEWTRKRKIGYAPGQRSGCTMTLWPQRNTGVLFGGVTDNENDEESLESFCHNDLFAYALSGNGRWTSLNLRRKKTQGGKRRRKAAVQPEQRRAAQSDGEEDEDEEGDETKDGQDKQGQEALSNNIVPTKAAPEEDDDPDDPQKSVPIGRYNAMLAVQRNVLYCYGGIHETADREYTLDDFYTLDLVKMERFNCLKSCPIDALEWYESSSSASGSSDSSSDSNPGEVEEREQPEGEEMAENEMDDDELLWEGEVERTREEIEKIKLERKREREALREKANTFLGVSKDAANRDEKDVISTPQPGESIKAFYERSRAYWASVAHEQSEGSARGKEMRRDGFALAAQKYEEYRPVLEEIVRIQASAGMDASDIKSMANGSTAGGKTGGIAGGGPGAESRNRR
ncbi:Protein containing repeated kelch motifs [Ceraceosorus bombacis]|uniref:Protein containing repeated kelch motifs n=1 Tax=Ceraceosorus bombacis TaxID=401625 RepID=A0A0P1BKF4_9BASI|nr:Protein containing repeated kelch motifs [Ceraceosorus bombacis]